MTWLPQTAPLSSDQETPPCGAWLSPPEELLSTVERRVRGIENAGVRSSDTDQNDSPKTVNLTANTKDLQSSRFAGVWIPMAIAIDSREKGFLAVW